jgi:hypothetical protein
MPHQPDTKVPRRRGRPKRSDSPQVNYNELDRLLVLGEVVPNKSGTGTRVVYPKYREVAERLGVSVSYVAEYSRTHNCMARREDAQRVIKQKADEYVIERRAKAIAFSREEELRLVDDYLAQFREALAAGRVRTDDAADLDKVLRLKEFLRGGADSRTEVHSSISLEAIQARYRKTQAILNATPAERGEVVRGALVAPESVIESPPAAPPVVESPAVEPEPPPPWHGVPMPDDVFVEATQADPASPDDDTEPSPG